MTGREADALLAGDAGTCRRILGLHLPQDQGGAGGGPVDQVQALHALAGASPSAAVYAIIQYLCIRMLSERGDAAQRALQHALVEGRSRAAFCLTEEGAGSDVFASLATRAEPIEGGWHLTGGKRWVAGAGTAQWLFVVARTGPHRTRDVSLFLVPVDRPGVRIQPRPSFAFPAYPTCDVEFVAVRLSRDDLVGGVGEGIAALAGGLHAERINAAAIASGIAHGAQQRARQVLRAAPASPQRAVLAGRMVEVMAATRAAWLMTMQAAAASTLPRAQPRPHSLPLDDLSACAKMAASWAAVDAATLGMDVETLCLGQPGALMQQYFSDGRLYVVGPRPNDVLSDLLAQRWLDAPQDVQDVPTLGGAGNAESLPPLQALAALGAADRTDAAAFHARAATVALQIARAAVADASGYARQRHVFGQPIAAYQAVRHRLVAVLLGVECAAALLQDATKVAGDAWRSGLALHAAADTATRAVQVGMEILGARGFDTTYPMPFYHRSARSALLGPPTSDLVAWVLAEPAAAAGASDPACRAHWPSGI